MCGTLRRIDEVMAKYIAINAIPFVHIGCVTPCFEAGASFRGVDIWEICMIVISLMLFDE